MRLSYPDYQYLRDHARAFPELFGSIVGRVNLGRGRNARQIWAEIVTGNYFQALGVRAGHGRTLLPSDEAAPGGHPVVVISDGLWRREFGADPDIVGKAIEMNNHRLTVVGVTDPAFHGTTVVYDVEAFVPVMMAPQARLQVRKPRDDAGGRPLRPPRRDLLPAGLPAAGHDGSDRGGGDRRALLGARPRAPAGRGLPPAPSRAVLGDARRGPDVPAADADRPDRHGAAGPDDRVRQRLTERASVRRPGSRPACGDERRRSKPPPS